jgi:hypothetical protein
LPPLPDEGVGVVEEGVEEGVEVVVGVDGVVGVVVVVGAEVVGVVAVTLGVVLVVVVGWHEAVTFWTGPTPAGTSCEGGVPGGAFTTNVSVWPLRSVTVTVH